MSDEEMSLTARLASAGVDHCDILVQLARTDKGLVGAWEFQLTVLASLARIEDRLRAIEGRIISGGE